MKLFTYSEGKLSLDREEILLYPALKRILDRDKGSPGDSDGRKKLQAWKDFTYIYLICDYASYPNQKGMNAKEAHKYAVDLADLPNDWLPDKELCIALDFYHDANETVARELNKELIASFKNSSRVVVKLREQTEILLEKSTLTSVEITTLTEMQGTLLNIASKLPNQLKSLKESNNLIKEEEKEGEVGRGGFVIPSSMNPDEALC
jgi:hypothetical protein